MLIQIFQKFENVCVRSAESATRRQSSDCVYLTAVELEPLEEVQSQPNAERRGILIPSEPGTLDRAGVKHRHTPSK